MQALPGSLLVSMTLLGASAVQATVISTVVNITVGTGSSATQSTSHPAGPANNAIDGNLGNFTHTNPPEPGFANGWWEVNLGTDRSFSNLRIYNRADCCQGRLRDLSVEVRDQLNAVLYTLTGINAGNAMNNPAFIDLALGSTVSTARYIRIERTPIAGQEATHDGATLSIGELLVSNQANVMLPAGSNLTHANIQAMSVSQSSTLGGFSAANGVNGVTGDFTHTLSSDTNPTWTLDLGEVMNLESFDIRNRGDGCCGYRLRDITVRVRDGLGGTVFTSSLLNPENILGGPASLAGLFPSGLTGRFVDISRTPDPDFSGQGGSGSPDDASVLSMGEVNIFGSSIPEPSAAALSLLALGALARRRRSTAPAAR